MALGFYNPLQRLLDGAGNRDNLTRAKPNYDLADRPALIPPNMIGRDNLNVTGQPVRSPEGGINRPSPVYDRPAFTPAGAFNPMVYHYTNPMVYQGPSDRELMPAEMYLRGDRPPPQETFQNPSAPYAATVDQVTRGLDPVTQQLLFGLDGEGGFIPGAMRAAERTFFDDEGNPVVIPEQVADFTQDQLDAFQLARSGVGSEGRFLSDAEAAYRSGIGSLTGGLERGLGVTEGATERLMEDLSGVEDIMRGTTRGYDPSMTEQFYNPYEDRVVQQTISDVLDAGDRADMAQTARDIATGGESAFGSRARLTAQERREALGRGLGEALGGIRSRGFTEAQRTGLGEFGRQLASERAAASGLAGLARSGYGAGTALGNLYGNIGQQQMLGQSRLGSALSGLGRQAQTARFGDIQSLLGGGNLQQQLAQQQLQASRANALQAQTAPLLQYQSLLPFIQTVPTGAMQTNIGFQPTPSPLQAGLGVGLSALGALGNFMNPNAYYSPANPYS